MPYGDIAFLTLIVGAFVVFMVTLALASWEDERFRRSNRRLVRQNNDRTYPANAEWLTDD